MLSPTGSSTATSPDRDQIMAGMACLDTSGNPNIPIIMEMVGDLSRATDPKAVLSAFAHGFYQLRGPQAYVSLSTRGLNPGEFKITRMLLEDDMETIAEPDPWRDWGEIPIHTGGFFGEMIRTAYPEVIHNFYLKNDPVVGNQLAEFGSLMAIPLFDSGEPLNWAITLRREPEAFTTEELEETILRSNLGGATVKNVMMTRQLKKANAKIRREMEQIASIQQALLPREMPNIPGVKMSVSYRVHDEAGGDYYDFFPLGRPVTSNDVWDGPWGLLVADAAGHGPAAAVLMAMLHAILHAYPDIPEHPSVVLKHANEHLCRKGIESSFVTAFLGIYHPGSRELIYACAGHPPPLLKAGGSGSPTDRLDAVGSVPLGVLPGVDYENATVTLQPGQTLVMYTDGITEAMAPDGTMFGMAGIEAALECCSGEVGCVQASIDEALLAHQQNVQPNDDQTLLALRVDDE